MSTYNNYEDDDESGSSTGGQSGQVEFRDFLAAGDQTRDDLLSSEQKKNKIR